MLRDVVPSVRVAIATIREETAQMGLLQRTVVWLSVICLAGCLLQALIALPLVILLYGWGYSVS